jgi:hypothetical protein
MNISGRIENILSGRKITPWAKSLGLSSGMATKLQGNDLPGSDILALISYAENASITWLTTGRGQPFIVQSCETAEEFKDIFMSCTGETISVLLSDNPAEGMAVVFSWQRDYPYKKKTIALREIRIAFCPANFSINALIDKTNSEERAAGGHDFIVAKAFNVGSDKLHAIRHGEVGTFTLFGDNKHPGWLSQYPNEPALLDRPLGSDKTALRVAVDVALMRTIIEAVEEIDEVDGHQLSSHQRARVITSALRYASKNNLSAEDFDPQLLKSLIEVL